MDKLNSSMATLSEPLKRMIAQITQECSDNLLGQFQRAQKIEAALEGSAQLATSNSATTDASIVSHPKTHNGVGSADMGWPTQLPAWENQHTAYDDFPSLPISGALGSSPEGTFNDTNAHLDSVNNSNLAHVMDHSTQPAYACGMWDAGWSSVQPLPATLLPTSNVQFPPFFPSAIRNHTHEQQNLFQVSQGAQDWYELDAALPMDFSWQDEGWNFAG